MPRLRLGFPAFCCFVILASCSRTEVHLHDRHSLSYPIIESYSKLHPGATLVLIDYHHDIGPDSGEILSSNWVARLLSDKAVDRVLWVSGRSLLLPNRNARIAWLRRSLASFPPGEAEAIESRIVLADWRELENGPKLRGPLVVSLDFDVFSNDPGDPPERFLDEIAAWMGRQRPGLTTLALSAAYEKEAASAWGWLTRFVDRYGRAERGAAWYLEAGERKPSAEGAEEARAWRLWSSQRELFGRRAESFLPGAGIWAAPPAQLRSGLLELGIRPGDGTAKDILEGWRDKDLAVLEDCFPQAATDSALAVAAAALEDSWRGARIPPPDADAAGVGVALRIQGKDGDRGCLALYRGVSDTIAAIRFCASGVARDPRYPPLSPAERRDLDLEVSIFGPWRGMRDPRDFRPGLDSLLLIDGKEETLLQASVAAQRGYSREEFLARLSNKAGLGLDGWTRRGLRFLRSATIWSRRPLSSIEATADYQKYEKK